MYFKYLVLNIMYYYIFNYAICKHLIYKVLNQCALYLTCSVLSPSLPPSPKGEGLGVRCTGRGVRSNN